MAGLDLRPDCPDVSRIYLRRWFSARIMDHVQELVCLEVAGGRRVVVFAGQARRLVDAGVATPLDPLDRGLSDQMMRYASSPSRPQQTGWRDYGD